MSSRFTAVTYNIFARSLGSSVIPWVLTVSGEAQALVDCAKPGFDIKEWVKRVATPHYKEHFHRNHSSGDKDAMRHMWSAAIDRQEQVPTCLKSVTCTEPDSLHYPADVASSSGSALKVGVTLRGLLRREFDRDVADVLFNDLTQNEEFFSWENRGPEIFKTVTTRAVAELLPESSSQQLSDIVTLLEVWSPHFAHAFHMHFETGISLLSTSMTYLMASVVTMASTALHLEPPWSNSATAACFSTAHTITTPS